MNAGFEFAPIITLVLQAHRLTSVPVAPNCQNIKQWLFPSRYIDDHQILQSDWLRAQFSQIENLYVIKSDKKMWEKDIFFY